MLRERHFRFSTEEEANEVTYSYQRAIGFLTPEALRTRQGFCPEPLF